MFRTFLHRHLHNQSMIAKFSRNIINKLNIFARSPVYMISNKGKDQNKTVNEDRDYKSDKTYPQEQVKQNDPQKYSNSQKQNQNPYNQNHQQNNKNKDQSSKNSNNYNSSASGSKETDKSSNYNRQNQKFQRQTNKTQDDPSFRKFEKASQNPNTTMTTPEERNPDFKGSRGIEGKSQGKKNSQKYWKQDGDKKGK